MFNVITQYFCIRGVYMMVGITDALSCTLILSVRKLLSLVLSIYVFQHTFTLMHACGVLLVLAGTTIYTKEQLGQSAQSTQTNSEVRRGSIIRRGSITQLGLSIAPSKERSIVLEAESNLQEEYRGNRYRGTGKMLRRAGAFC